MSFDITSPSEESNVKMLIFGSIGSGKTHFCGTTADCEEAKDVLMISPEKGEITIQDKDIDVIQLNDFSQMEEIYEFLKIHERFGDDDEKLEKAYEKYSDEVPDDLPHYNTVIIDSLTELERYSKMDVRGHDMDTPISDVDSMQIQHFGDNKENIVGYLRKFRDLDMNVIFTATEKRDKDEKTGEVSILPNLTGSLAEDVAEFLHIVGYTFKKRVDDEVQYGMMFESGNKVRCKQRFGLPSTIKDPKFSEIYNHVQ